MSARSRSSFLIVGSTVLLLALRPGPALAISRFPGNISDYFTPHLGYTPPCRLCHIDGTTGSGSVQTPFGVSMLAQGLTGERSTLTPALDALKAGEVDSDGRRRFGHRRAGREHRSQHRGRRSAIARRADVRLRGRAGAGHPQELRSGGRSGPRRGRRSPAPNQKITDTQRPAPGVR